jgi:hypothetical protein
LQVAGSGIALEARHRCAPVVFGQRAGLDRAGEEAAPQRAERHEADAELGERRQDLRLDVAGPQRILALQRGHRSDRMGAADRHGIGFRQAEVANFARADQVADRARDLLDRDIGIEPVLVEQVDPVGAQPPERAFDHLADAFGPAVEALALAAVGREAEAELAGDHHLVPDARQPRAKLLLVETGAVNLGGVEEGDPAIVGRAQQIAGLGFAERRAIGARQAHAAQPQRGNLQPLAQCACLHRALPKRQHGIAWRGRATYSAVRYERNKSAPPQRGGEKIRGCTGCFGPA